jgi:hypothetical protein
VRVPGKLKRSAAVAWWRNEAERRKYAGNAAKYNKTETKEIARRNATEGGCTFGITDTNNDPM